MILDTDLILDNDSLPQIQFISNHQSDKDKSLLQYYTTHFPSAM